MTLFTTTHLKSVAIFVSTTATTQGSAGLEILMGNASMKELSKNPMACYDWSFQRSFAKR